MKLSSDQKKAIKTFNNFLQDKEAFDMFLVGSAGTGKTTVLNQVVQLCLDNEIPTVVCAYTHKAKEVLQSKLPKEADVRTLHSFLRKRPGINESAKSVHKLQVTTQFGKPQEVKLLIVDEYSMVGESDAMSIGELQDPEYEGVPQMKVLYVGDERQLPPVGQPFTLQAGGKYVAELKEVQRQAAGPLLDTICEIVDMIDGKTELHHLEPNEEFHRGVDIFEHIAHNKKTDKIVLAYTNKRVQELNEQLAALLPRTSLRWSPTLRAELNYEGSVRHEDVISIHTHSGELLLDSKYRTLEHLTSMREHRIEFGVFQNLTDSSLRTYAYVFGHYNYKIKLEELGQAAADSNAAIDHPVPKRYCLENPHCKKCRRRAKAWRDYLTFKECVMLVDYPYAQTIHKSQGSTFENVYIDNEDLKLLLNKGNVDLYLKLLYVGVSRASDQVFMNS